MAMIPYPEGSDLRSLLRFLPEEGLIWLGEHRMLLLHVGALAALRKELIASVGKVQARRLLTRMGFVSGMRDAELAKKTRPHGTLSDAFIGGPQLYMLEGSARAIPLSIELEAGTFHGEFVLDHSWEAQAHLQEIGTSDEPACWMMTGYASGYTSAFMNRFIVFRETACAAMGQERCQIVGKPAEEWSEAPELIGFFQEDPIVGRLLELREEIERMRERLVEPRRVPKLIGASAAFLRTYDLLERAAGTQVTVLLLGETGVGKERFARTLHELSPRKNGPFVAVNCAAIPEELIESELFGVERGAFTGAHAPRAGKFERADGGTLFLDEVGELSLAAQAKLLRVLQEGEIERLGGEQVRKINVRLVAATNVDLQQAVESGRFRRDLFYRLNVYPIHIPPLRERISDIPLLVEAMIERFQSLHGKKIAGISDKAMLALKAYRWPGNVRELENMIERGVILAPNHGTIEAEHLFAGNGSEEARAHILGTSGGLEEKSGETHADLADALLERGVPLESFERLVLQRAVERARGNLSAAARLLGLTRPQLSYRLRKEGGTANDKG
jgi:DNA-binding NtrC family response regulator